MKKVSEKMLCEGKFLSLKESVFLNRDGKEVKWESVVRKNKRPVISIIAKLMPSDRYVLIRQFRAAVNNHVLGFPAGISDGDNIEEEALRELKEETGYTGTSVELSPCFRSGAAVIDDEVFIASITIDEKDPRNKKPVQELEPDEQIEVVPVKKSDIKKLVMSELDAGRLVGSGVWYLVLAGS